MRGCNADGQLDTTQYSKPLPWIGVYVAAASLLCAAAMALDTYSGFRRRRFWFPSRVFSLNSATLTLLGVATKFPVDLNTSMPRSTDQLTKLSGTALICVAMANFVPSFGRMSSSEVVSNVVAIAVLVVTVIVNVGMQMGTGVIYIFLPEHVAVMLLMVALLLILLSSALTVSATKERLEMQYNCKYMKASDDDEADKRGNTCTLSNLKRSVTKNWLMVHTSCPEYGRSETCTASGALCLVAASVFTEALVRAFFIKGRHMEFCGGKSDYQWSTALVLVSQTTAVLTGAVAPAIRWFYAYSRSAEGWRWNGLKVERYWIQRLHEWKLAPLPFRFGSRRCWKCAHHLRNWALTVLIRMQLGVVLASKLVHFAPILMGTWLNKGACWLSTRKMESSPASLRTENGGAFCRYVLYMEWERDWVKLIGRLEQRDTEKQLERGRRNQPAALLELIQRHSSLCEGFTEAGAFDSDRVPSLVPEEPPNCWALPVVTLACIAIVLPNVDRRPVESLLDGVCQGLRYVRLVDRNLDAKGLVNMRHAANAVWLDVNVHNRWFDLDLQRLALTEKNGRKTIETVGNVAKNCVKEFLGGKLKSEGDATTSTMEWPGRVLAANCMYRLCATILQDYDGKHRTEANLFAWLRRAISDVLGACLTNVPLAIHMESSRKPVEASEQSAKEAASMVGEVERILQILEDPRHASFFPDVKEYVDDWRERRPIGRPRLTSDELCLSMS